MLTAESVFQELETRFPSILDGLRMRGLVREPTSELSPFEIMDIVVIEGLLRSAIAGPIEGNHSIKAIMRFVEDLFETTEPRLAEAVSNEIAEFLAADSYERLRTYFGPVTDLAVRELRNRNGGARQ